VIFNALRNVPEITLALDEVGGELKDYKKKLMKLPSLKNIRNEYS